MLINIGLLAFLAAAIDSIFINPDFDETNICHYVSYFSNGNDTFELESTSYNTALQLSDSKDGTDSNSLARI